MDKSRKEGQALKYIGMAMFLLGIASAESEWIWVPWLLIGAGAVLLAKKKTPSSRQAKEGDLKNFKHVNYNTGRRRISNEKV